jgi:type I restriction enzyme S subunit
MRYRKPEELKETDVAWIDEIPKGWDYAPIKWFVKTMNGYAFRSSDYLGKNAEDGVPIIRIGDIQNGGIELSDLRRLPNGFLNEHKDYQLLNNDLLIAMSGATVGKVGKYDLNEKGLLNQRVGCLRANKGIIPEYLWYVMNSDQFENYIQFYARGGAQPNISDSVIINFPGSLPPKPEQRSIAAFLDRKTEAIDGLIQKKEQLIERLKEKRQALITRAVTKGLDPDVPMKDSDIEWLGEIPEAWEITKVKWLVSKIGSGKTPRGGSEVYEDEGIPFLRSQNIHFDRLRLDDVVYIRGL